MKPSELTIPAGYTAAAGDDFADEILKFNERVEKTLATPDTPPEKPNASTATLDELEAHWRQQREAELGHLQLALHLAKERADLCERVKTAANDQITTLKSKVEVAKKKATKGLAAAGFTEKLCPSQGQDPAGEYPHLQKRWFDALLQRSPLVFSATKAVEACKGSQRGLADEQRRSTRLAKQLEDAIEELSGHIAIGYQPPPKRKRKTKGFVKVMD